ncbi:MAG TPA: nuclear transport factor 2 family protein [Acidimicrobiales bacterium]|nr:nuclear transport factor 2 family protein [Acidimicrobiales bacterium]
MIDPGAAVEGQIGGALGASVADPISVQLVDPGPQPLEVLSVLTELGCPSELAADYVGASAGGTHPEVLVGARLLDAARVAEALRAAGAAVSMGPIIAAPAARSGGAPAGAPKTTVEASDETRAGPPHARSRAAPQERQASGSNLLEIDAVERYLAAYNSGDRSGLLGCLSATAVLSDATGQVLVHGAQAIGRRMADVFEHYPDRQVTVVGRLIAGPWVLDHHRTTFGGGSSEETVLCFRVEGGLIERLVLLR